jgi:SAM-dependent methyltransferase
MNAKSREFSSSSSAAGFQYSGSELDAMAQAHNYYAWILSQFAPFLGDDVVEVGAGAGSFAARMLAARPASRFSLIEPAANLIPGLEQRFHCNPRVRVLPGNLVNHSTGLSADTAVMVNVLEHVQDDVFCIRTLHDLLRPAGHFLIFAPALPAIYGSLDEAFEHYRRYTKPSLAHKLRGAGFTIVKIRYVNFPGVAAWWMSGKLLRRTTLPSSSVRFYDRWVIPWLSRLEQTWEPPIGQSVLAIARR